MSPTTGQVILEAARPGSAGEAGLVPVTGVDLAFDRGDGHLVRAVRSDADSGQAAATLLNRLFGPQAAQVLNEVVASSASRGAPQPQVLSPEPVLCAALSSLARLDAARDTSPVPRRSPWWAAEAAVLAEQAGLHARARAEANGRFAPWAAVSSLFRPGRQDALAAAGIAAAADPDAVRRLRDASSLCSQPYEPSTPGLDVAAEVEELEKDSVRLPG